jgi:sulfhydrogenase subunit beta (sulfur reductase)
MRYATLLKSNLNDFIASIASKQKVMAPVYKGYKNYAFEQVSNAKDISLEYIPTVLSPKKYFMPQYETLAEYNIDGQQMEGIVEVENMVIFGVHTCDIAGIQCLNVVFSDRPKDLNYLIRKNKIGIIGIECIKKCDEYATCGLMDNYTPNGGYDLFFTDLGDYFMVHSNTHYGDDLIDSSKVFGKAEAKNYDELEKLRSKKTELFKKEINVELDEIPKIFDKCKESPVWDEIGSRCLACGNCTNVCPSCYCFDVQDELNMDLKTGKRIRVWDSCQNEPFAVVAGGENFREKRSDRKRHRFFRKFKYPVVKYSRFFCTGCGRCTRTCMAEISLPDTIKALVKEYK